MRSDKAANALNLINDPIRRNRIAFGDVEPDFKEIGPSL
jgi:hypothetical protein